MPELPALELPLEDDDDDGPAIGGGGGPDIT
jgi:hypothetical protein